MPQWRIVLPHPWIWSPLWEIKIILTIVSYHKASCDSDLRDLASLPCRDPWSPPKILDSCHWLVHLRSARVNLLPLGLSRSKVCQAPFPLSEWLESEAAALGHSIVETPSLASWHRVLLQIVTKIPSYWRHQWTLRIACQWSHGNLHI